MTFNPKWHNQRDTLRREMDEMRRYRRNTFLLFGGTAIAIAGLSLIATDWFGTGLILAVVGFAVATIGSEDVK